MTTAQRNIRNMVIGIGGVLAIAAAPAFAMEPGAMDHGAMDHGAMDHSHMQMPAQTPAAAAMIDGEVRKIDVELGQVTIKHGEIKNLAMPGMTMAYTAKDKALLADLKVGDKIKFTAAKENGKLIVTTIEVQPAK
jgi:Cu/Ag efflux protein CusF